MRAPTDEVIEQRSSVSRAMERTGHLSVAAFGGSIALGYAAIVEKAVAAGSNVNPPYFKEVGDAAIAGVWGSVGVFILAGAVGAATDRIDQWRTQRQAQ